MSKLSISEAIRLSGVSRSQFYTKYINKGVISVTVDDGKKLIDTSELIRVFGNIQLSDSINEQGRTTENTEKQADKNKIIELLEHQLVEARAREQEAKDREMLLRKETQERENWLKSQLEKAAHLLENKTSKPRKKFLGIF
jgi:hypothetical protein